MPGICGIVQANPAIPVAASLTEMLQSMTHQSWYAVEQHSDNDAGVALGRVSLGIVDSDSQPAVVGRWSEVGGRRSEQLTTHDSPLRDAWAVLDGELYRTDELRNGLQSAGHHCRSDSHAELLLRGYLAEGRAFLRRINGKFSAAIWDGRNRRLILTNDKIGMKPLYYCQAGGRLLFGSEIKALLRGGDVSRRINFKGLAQFFSFGHLWGEETFYESVRILPAGAWVTYDADDDRLTVDRYHRFTAPSTVTTDRGELLDRIDSVFKRAVDDRTAKTADLGLSLSGGLDARTILGVMDCRETPVRSVCLGIEGSLDHRSSQQLAALAGSEYHAYTLNDAFLSRYEEHLREMVRLTDGHYLSQCIVMPTLPYYRELGIRVLLRGHGGELLHLQKAYNFSLDREGLELQNEAGLKSWLSNHLRAYMTDGVDGPLFQQLDRNDLESLARETLHDALAETADWQSQQQRISHLFVTQRLRRETAMSLVKFGSVVETRLPYVDPDVFNVLMSVPTDMKLGEEIQAHLLKKHRPEFLNVTNVNTGARVGAGPIALKLGYYRMRVLAKLGVKGYQPYERLGLWLRRELRPLVQKILLGERCLQRGVFQPETVRRVVEQHFNQQRNHTFLLMALMIFELGLQMFADGEASLTAGSTVRSDYA